MEFAVVKIALIRGARVIAPSSETFAGRLRDLGATVTSYGSGLAIGYEGFWTVRSI